MSVKEIFTSQTGPMDLLTGSGIMVFRKMTSVISNFLFQSKRTGERPFPHAKRHERKSARAKRSSPRYPLRGSALGKGKLCT